MRASTAPTVVPSVFLALKMRKAGTSPCTLTTTETYVPIACTSLKMTPNTTG